MDRKPISSIVGNDASKSAVFLLRLPTTNEPDALRHDLIVIARVDNRKAVAFISRDGLFDADGNYFVNDI